MNRSIQRAGFTLVELMVVLVILAILGALAIPRFSEARANDAASGLARQIFTMAQQARYTALSTARQVRIRISPSSNFVQMQVALVVGEQILGDESFGPVESEIQLGGIAGVIGVQAGANPTTAPIWDGGVERVLIFYPSGNISLLPDGSGATIFVADLRQNHYGSHPYRVLLFGATGFAKVIDR